MKVDLRDPIEIDSFFMGFDETDYDAFVLEEGDLEEDQLKTNNNGKRDKIQSMGHTSVL